jgi:hypothetical protein
MVENSGHELISAQRYDTCLTVGEEHVGKWQDTNALKSALFRLPVKVKNPQYLHCKHF